MTLNITKKDIVYVVTMLVMAFCLCFTVSKCSTYKNLNTDNIEAFTDSISYYKDQNGELVASKLLVQGEYEKLKLVNEELYNKIEAMKLKKDPENVVHVETVIEHTKTDTVLVVKNDSASFNFSNEYRTLTGRLYMGTDSINMVLDKDEVYLDYTLVTKDNRVYVSSTNPYVKFKHIDGIMIPREKEKKWVIGPSISTGYDFALKEFNVYLGVSLTYNLISF